MWDRLNREESSLWDQLDRVGSTMGNRLYRAGFPATATGWTGFLLAVALGTALTALAAGVDPLPLAGLILLTWLANLATVHWAVSWRLVCHVFCWVVLYRAVVPERAWYLVVPAALLLAGAVIWEQERRVVQA